MKSTDVFLRHTDKKGAAWVRCHRVWDRDRFLETQLADATKEGGSIAVLTEAEYEAERRAKR